uniref:Putative transcriptional regulator, ArsR family (Modular protein) n=1 Tax=Magnetococcus massalia (strain MO-1) TaxID=451514 RepID=A0A1S7LFF1_MAGMO|nr:Putative transcriptional regulator, ArsR family (modular protein) [Candidatus Magnetococcus massalia]
MLERTVETKSPLTPQVLLKAMVDETRFRCLMLLLSHGEMCVCELVQSLKVAQPKVSRNLTILRNGDLVSSRRQGQWIHYKLNPNLPPWARTILEAANEGLTAESLCHLDRQQASLVTSKSMSC